MSILGDSEDGPLSPTRHGHWCPLLLAKAAAVTRLVTVLALEPSADRFPEEP